MTYHAKFLPAREILEAWTEGRRDRGAPRRLANLLSLDDLTVLVWLYPPDGAAEDRIDLLDRTAAELGGTVGDLRRALLLARGQSSSVPLGARVEALLDQTESGSLERCLALHLLLVTAFDLDRFDACGALERELAREARRTGSHLFRLAARIRRFRRRLVELDVDGAHILLRRIEHLSRASLYPDLTTPYSELLAAMLREASDDPECLWSYLALRRDYRLLAHLRDFASFRAAEILAERRQIASSLAIKLDLAHRAPRASDRPDHGAALLALGRDLMMVGETEIALRYVDDAIVEIAGDARGEALIGRAYAMRSILRARQDDASGARESLARARSSYERTSFGDPESQTLLAYAECVLLSRERGPARALEAAAESLRTLDRTTVTGPWAARLAGMRTRLMRSDGRRDGLGSAIDDCIYLAAQANEIDVLRDAYFLQALHHAEAPETCEKAIEACKEAERITLTILEALRADRDMLFRILPHDATVRTVVSSYISRLTEHADNGLQDLFELSRTVVEQARRGRDLVQALRRSQRSMARVLENLPVIVWSCRGKAHGFACTHFEGAIEEIFGRAPGDFEDRPRLWLDVIHDQDRDRVVDLLAQVEATLDIESVEFRIGDRNDVRWVELRLMPVLGEPDGDDTLHGLMIDVTERKRLHHELQQVRKMEAIGQLAAGVSHDFNNILSSILGAATLLASTIESDDDAAQLVSIIEQAAIRGAEATSRLGAFSHRSPTEPVPIDVNELVSGTVEMARHTVGRAIEVVFEGTEETLSIDAVPASITQALLNVVMNASDAEPKDHRVVVQTARDDGGRVAIIVRDDGRGMDAATLEQAYDPFFTTAPSSQTRKGLGLTTVYHIVQDFGGDIHIDSRPGEGTVVTMTFPAGSPLPERPRRAAPRPKGTKRGGRLLLIDDEAQVLVVTEKILASAGYDVVTARDGLEGLEAFSADPASWDIVVTDVRMPRRDGLAVVRQIRELSNEPPILMMTGYADEEPAELTTRHENVALIQKPFTASAFVEAALELMSASREATNSESS